ncbi:MAG: c-type cytochrome [Hyphomicrobiaceae bacterium]
MPISRQALAVILLVSTACAAQGNSSQADRVSRGRDLAQAHCSVCHAVTESDPSPAWVNSNTPFRRLYERYPIAMLQDAAATGLISGHDEMPGFAFALEDIAALLAYIDSLAPDKPAYLKKTQPQ